MAGGMGDIDDSVRKRIDRAENIEYRGFVSEAEKFDLLSRCRAVVFNGRNEDFGIVPIEANASEKSVLSRDEGFPGLYITDGENGYTHDGTSADIIAAIERFERNGIDGEPGTTAAQFSMDRFRSSLQSAIETQWAALTDLSG